MNVDWKLKENAQTECSQIFLYRVNSELLYHKEVSKDCLNSKICLQLSAINVIGDLSAIFHHQGPLLWEYLLTLFNRCPDLNLFQVDRWEYLLSNESSDETRTVCYWLEDFVSYSWTNILHLICIWDFLHIIMCCFWCPQNIMVHCRFLFISD